LYVCRSEEKVEIALAMKKCCHDVGLRSSTFDITTGGIVGIS